MESSVFLVDGWRERGGFVDVDEGREDYRKRIRKVKDPL
jgi:hypothetical protein